MEALASPESRELDFIFVVEAIFFGMASDG